MRTSLLTLATISTLPLSALTQTVINISGDTTETLTGAAASSWKASYSSAHSTDLADITSSCFPFCDGDSPTSLSLSSLDGSSLASSISAQVSSNLASATADSSDLASSLRSSVSSVVASATSAASQSGNGAAGLRGSVGGEGWMVMMGGLAAGVVGVAAFVL